MHTDKPKIENLNTMTKFEIFENLVLPLKSQMTPEAFNFLLNRGEKFIRQMEDQDIDLLIEDYERRLKTVSEMISNGKSSGSINDTKKFERLVTKQSEYRTFIMELRRVTNPNPAQQQGTPPPTSKPSYILGDDSINGIKINEKIRNEEMFEYRIIYLKDFIDDLCQWIGESNKDEELMKEDLKMLIQLEDEYIFSSISTNDYIYEGHHKFEETCEELLKLNSEI